MSKDTSAELERTPLWGKFAATSTDDQRVLVKSLVRHATPLLSRVADTFPTYTLHDERHAVNVIDLMCDLLGNNIDKLSPLECAILILSAYYHDIGMVHAEGELKTLDRQPWFSQFLKTHPEAYIKYHQDEKKVSDYLAEWYCRWRHAERVFVHLNEIPDEELLWGVVSIREALGQVCRSHNLSAGALLEEGDFAVDFLGVCDLRMCAILLRLADLLDFDRTRSPQALFDHLKLATGTSNKSRQSRLEWTKHLASDGFIFPDHRTGDYPITLIAAPDNPAIEHDIREFLDMIEREFKECLAVRRSCSQRWRDHPLPEAVNRTQIKSRGYRYGNYRFELDRGKVLRLFMGDNLYQSSYAFVRELIQNSIDTSRHREYYERASGEAQFNAPPIRINDWRDGEGRKWVRIEDFGMGMDEALIERYFLAVGNSYYRSAEFEADLLRYGQSGKDRFRPISRFGIGLLSCFLMADLVEVSTRHISNNADVSAALRLSLNGIDAYYTLQAEPLRSKAMPAPAGEEEGYRTEVGTSIALRIDAQKEELFDLSRIVDRYVMASPIPITVNGVSVGGRESDLYERPWRSSSEFLSLMPDATVALDGVSRSDPGGVVLKLVPLNLTAVSPDRRFRGQMMMIFVRGYRDAGVMFIYDFRFRHGQIEIPLEALHPDPRHEPQGDKPRIQIDLSSWICDDERDVMRYLPDALNISHNGVRVPMFTMVKGEEEGTSYDGQFGMNSAGFFGGDEAWAIATGELDDPVALNAGKANSAGGIAGLSWDSWMSQYKEDFRYRQEPPLSWTIAGRIGAFELKDELHPEFSVSRDVVSGWDWNVLSCIHLAYGRSLLEAGDELTSLVVALGADLFGDFVKFGQLNDYYMSMIMADPLMTSGDGWRALPILPVFASPPYLGEAISGDMRPPRPKLMSYEQLMDILHEGGADDDQFVRVPSLQCMKGQGLALIKRSFFELVSAALLQQGVRLGFDRAVPQMAHRFGGNEMVTYRILGAHEGYAEEGLQAYSPLAFVEYLDNRFLRMAAAALNINHPISRWLIDATPAMRASKRGVLSSLWQELTAERWKLFGSGLDKMVVNVNYLLDSLRHDGFSHAPPYDVVLSKDDFWFE